MTDQAQLDTLVQKLRNAVEQQILPEYRWYWTHRTGPRISFRLAGGIVVIGSLLLPVIASFKGWSHRDSVLTVVSLTVAILSSLSTFFRWDATWRSRTKAATELKGLLARWELALTSLETTRDPQQAALSATQKLFDEAYTLIGSETEGFFATVKWPDTSKIQ